MPGDDTPSDLLANDPLDHLLTETASVSVNPEQVSRLQHSWDRITSRRRRIRRTLGASMVLLACVTLGPAFRFSLHSPLADPELVTVPLDVNRPAQAESTSTRSDNGSKSLSESRERQRRIETYERAVFAVANRQIQEEQFVSRAETLSSCLQSMTTAFSQEPAEGVDAAAIARPLRVWPEYESMLLKSEVLRQRDSPRKRAAIALLCEIASPRSLPDLLGMLNTPDCPAHVLRAVVRVASAETLAQLARTTMSPAVQYEIAAGLLRKDDPGLRAYLQLVKSPHASAAALMAADQLSPEQIDFTFGLLGASRVADRLSAAAVLGQINNPRVTEALASRVVRNESRFEALIALASSKDLNAGRFLAAAQEDVLLAASVRAARIRARQLFSG